MALKILQPGIQPLGQYALKAGEATDMVGGEVGVFEAALSGAAELKKGSPSAGQMYGLLDEGIAGYGTMLGEVEHVRATWVAGAVVVGPHTALASNKATLWTKPGLYGVTASAWADSDEFDGVELNDKLYGSADPAGKLTSTATGAAVALFIEKMSDSSLVSTTTLAATGSVDPTVEYAAIYLLGVQA